MCIRRRSLAAPFGLKGGSRPPSDRGALLAAYLHLDGASHERDPAERGAGDGHSENSQPPSSRTPRSAPADAGGRSQPAGSAAGPRSTSTTPTGSERGAKSTGTLPPMSRKVGVEPPVSVALSASPATG
jgi:hypothetical protein